MMGTMDRIILILVFAVLFSASSAPVSGAQNQLGRSANQESAAGAKTTGIVNYGMAQGCIPPTLPVKEAFGAIIPAMASLSAMSEGGPKPNFIVVLTDDQGYDDIGLHQPQKPGGKPTWVETPNLDKFLRQATEFDNFYVAPMCSQSRAALLTGRDFPRTGTMLINGGYDYINRDEITAGNLFGGHGYDTAHFGKWHNGRTLGYEPWEMGFQESWLPSSHVHLDNLMRHNGRYVQTKGLMEQDLMDKILGYLGEHERSDKPFFLYYAPYAIHQGFLRPGQGPRWQRPAPEPYKSKYKNMLPRLPSDTAEVWGMLEYMDDVLGRLFDYMDKSPLRDNTYIFVMSDNGAELFPTERRGKDKLRRMPSGMMGYKKSVEEGGIRNYLAVKGPGVQAGVVDSTLLSITDILPTIADLAGLTNAYHLPWDGLSFKNLLLAGGGRPAAALRGTQLTSRFQSDRYIFSMGPQCWSSDMVPQLGPDREVIKPQKMLDYDKGGVDGRGFQKCIGVRYKDYKWLGETGKVYQFWGNSHIELPCNEVTGPEKEAIAAELSAFARKYFQSLVADEHSFMKPTFYLGLKDWSVTNILPDGAHERTLGRVELLPNGAAGFSRVGDSMCFAAEIATAGQYKVAVMYTSQVQATFKLSVGVYNKIKDGSAPSVTARLPASRNMKTKEMGYLDLYSSAGRHTEICFVLIATSSPGTPVFENLSNIRFTKQGGKRSWEGWIDKGEQDWNEKSVKKAGNSKNAAAVQSTSSSSSWGKAAPAPPSAASQKSTGATAPPSTGGTSSGWWQPVFDVDYLAQDSVIDTWEEFQQRPLHSNLQATPAMQQAEREALQSAALHQQYDRSKESMRTSGASNAANITQGAAAWQQVRQLYGWVDGQQDMLESLYSPYESEGIYECADCQPEL